MIENKINIARRIIEEMYTTTHQIESAQKLKDILEKAELSYNDLKVKQIKSDEALHAVIDIENKLDVMIKENIRFIKNNSN